MIAGAEGAGEAGWIGVAGEHFPVGTQKMDGFFWGFLQKFEAEVSQACGQQIAEMGCARLRARVKNGVAATDIGSDGVGFADSVAHGDMVAIARTPTGEVVFSIR